jgi:hypothetical protein
MGRDTPAFEDHGDEDVFRAYGLGSSGTGLVAGHAKYGPDPGGRNDPGGNRVSICASPKDPMDEIPNLSIADGPAF